MRWVVPALMFLTVPLCARDFAPVYRHDAQHTGRFAIPGPDLAERLWTFRTASTIPGSIVTSSNGTLYVASADRRLYALTTSGGLQWTFEANESIYATPSVSPDGSIVVADLSGAIYSLRPDGVLQWSSPAARDGEHRVVASPVIAPDGSIYVCSWDDLLSAWSREGSLRWQVRLSGLPSSAPALDLDGNIYIACRDLADPRKIAVYKLDPAGRPVWKFSDDLDGSNDRILSTPALDVLRNRLYVGACRARDGVLYGVDLTNGRPLFRTTFDSGLVSSPAVAGDGSVLVASIKGQVRSVDPESGRIRWSFYTGGAYLLGSPVVDVAGRVFIGDSDGVVYCLSPSGQEIWSYRGLDSSVNSSPMLDEFARIYVTTADGSVVALGDPDRSNVFYFPQLADGRSGGIRYRTNLTMVNTGCDTVATVEMFDSSGAPLEIAFDSATPASVVSRPLKHAEAFSMKSSGEGPLRAGYARVTAGPGVGGTAVFSYSETGLELFEAGVPAATSVRDFSLAVQGTASSRYFGLALVNAGTASADIVFRLYGPGGQLVATRPAREPGGQLGVGAHLARYAHEIFPELIEWGTRAGLMTVESTEPLAAVALRFWDDPAVQFPSDVPTMSPVPIVEGRSETGATTAPRAFHFPHFATGRAGDARYRAGLTLVNPGKQTDVGLELRDQAGAAMVVNFAGRIPGSSLHTVLEQGEVLWLETDGEGPLQVGSVTVTASSELGGTEIFSFSQGDGPILSEAGVPASQGIYSFALYVDHGSPSRNTGVAVLNPGSGTANLVFRLRDVSGNLLATGDQSLGPGAQLARFVAELFPELSPAELKQAVLWVDSDQPVSAVTLQQRRDPQLVFPLDVHSITTFPIIPAGP